MASNSFSDSQTLLSHQSIQSIFARCLSEGWLFASVWGEGGDLFAGRVLLFWLSDFFRHSLACCTCCFFSSTFRCPLSSCMRQVASLRDTMMAWPPAVLCIASNKAQLKDAVTQWLAGREISFKKQSGNPMLQIPELWAFRGVQK